MAELYDILLKDWGESPHRELRQSSLALYQGPGRTRAVQNWHAANLKAGYHGLDCYAPSGSGGDQRLKR